MKRLAFAVIFALALSLRAATPELGQLDASPTLFTVLAAINAAGYDADLASPNNHPLRQAIRDELAKRKIPSLEAIKEFVAKHRRSNVVELNPYISFALTAGPPPNFEITMRDVEIPPDVSSLKEFSFLLAAFYKEADIEDLWKRSQRSIDQYIERYHQPVSDAVLQVNSLLRQQTSGVRGSSFQVLVELQAAPNQIQTRSYGPHYTVVVAPSPEPRTFDIRHAYLHYSLEPLATRYEEVLKRKKALADHAQRAQALDFSFKEDFLLLTTESLIKAIEARLDRRPEKVQEALLDGFVLTPYFAEQLPVYEKQEQSMNLYYPQMVGSIELTKEDARLSKVEFNKSRPDAAAVKSAPPPPPALTGAAKTLDDAEQLYKSNELDPAKARFLQALEQTDQKPLHAAAYYGLARIAIKQKDLDTAERLFQKTLELEPEAWVKAWTLVYLGRLSLNTENGGPEAAKYFHRALEVEGASEEARRAAQQGLQQASK